MRVFPDANFLVAAGFRPAGTFRKVLNTGLDSLVTSESVLMEVERNLQRLGPDPTDFLALLRTFMDVTDQFDILPAGLPLQGAGDRQALAEAIGASCDLFVTSDTDFAALFGQRVKGVLVEMSATFVRRALAQLPQNNLGDGSKQERVRDVTPPARDE